MTGTPEQPSPEQPSSPPLPAEHKRRARETVEAKARRYLTEGRVVVRYAGPAGVRAFVRGTGAIYNTERHGASWICTCAARGRCAHIAALELVTAMEH